MPVSRSVGASGSSTWPIGSAGKRRRTSRAMLTSALRRYSGSVCQRVPKSTPTASRYQFGVKPNSGRRNGSPPVAGRRVAGADSAM